MKASKFSDAQKAYVVKPGEEGVSVAELCIEAGISQATYFNWKKKYAGLMPSEMKRLRELERKRCGNATFLMSAQRDSNDPVEEDRDMERFEQNYIRLLDKVRGCVGRMEVPEGPTGRRSWPDEEKVRIVRESLGSGPINGIHRRVEV